LFDTTKIIHFCELNKFQSKKIHKSVSTATVVPEALLRKRPSSSKARSVICLTAYVAQPIQSDISLV